jgi:hypothetical protein
LSKNRTEEITEPAGNVDSNLERQQYLVNQWIGGGGGQMSDLNSAAHDPVFFNHQPSLTTPSPFPRKIFDHMTL